jgi:hypothetical protein
MELSWRRSFGEPGPPLGVNGFERRGHAGRGVIRGGPHGCHAEGGRCFRKGEGGRMKEEHVFFCFFLHSYETASPRESMVGIRQFFCRGLIRAVDRRVKQTARFWAVTDGGLVRGGSVPARAETGMYPGCQLDTGERCWRRGSRGKRRVSGQASQPGLQAHPTPATRRRPQPGRVSPSPRRSA